MDHNITALHSYRAILIPANADASNLEDLADAGLLPTIRLKAGNATQAEAQAHLASGKGVLRVERVEEWSPQMPRAITSCFIRPCYEGGHLWHWEVLFNPEQIRPGCVMYDDSDIFVEEHQARDFVRHLKAENPELVELAVVPDA